MTLPKAAVMPLLMEMCTAFAYLGYMSNLTSYLKDYYNLEDSTVIILVHLFAASATSIPVAGAYLADNFFGRFRIVTTNIFCFAFGMLLMAIGSVLPLTPWVRITLTAIGSLIVAVCVGVGRSLTATFAADQMPITDVKGRESVFATNYLLTNSAVIVALIVLPNAKYSFGCWGMTQCHSFVYGAGLIAVVFGLMFFMIGFRDYSRQFDKSSSVNKVARCIMTAIANKGSKDAGDSLLDSLTDTHDDCIPTTKTFLDRAYPRFSKRYIRRVHNLILTVKVCAIVAVAFYAMFYQVFSSFVIQSSRLNPRFGMLVANPEIITAFYPIVNVVGTFILNKGIYRAVGKYTRVTYLRRMGAGAVLAAASFYVAGTIDVMSIPPPSSNNHSIARVNSTINCNYNITGTPFTHQTPGDLLIWSDECSFNRSFDVKSRLFFVEISQLPNGDISFSERAVTPAKPSPDSVDLYFQSTVGFLLEHNILNPGNSSKLPENSMLYTLKCNIISHPIYRLHMNGSYLDLDTRDLMGGAYEVSIDVNNELVITELIPPNTVSIFYQLIAIFLLAMGEVLIVLSGFEFAFSQSPRSLKATMQSTWLIFAFLGNIITMALAKIPSYYAFFIYAGFMTVSLLLFIYVTYDFSYFIYEDADIDDPEIPSDTVRSDSDNTDPTISGLEKNSVKESELVL